MMEVKTIEKGTTKKFVRYEEGAMIYSMSVRKFKDLARDAGALYKVGKKLVLVNVDMIDDYLEYFHVME